MLELDVQREAAKEALWESGLSIEGAFNLLDRYKKGYVADTDVWQLMHEDDNLMSMKSVHSQNNSVSFSGVCAKFREIKHQSANNAEVQKSEKTCSKSVKQAAQTAATKQGQMNLQELTRMLFPLNCEENLQIQEGMSDDDSVVHIIATRVKL